MFSVTSDQGNRGPWCPLAEKRGEWGSLFRGAARLKFECVGQPPEGTIRQFLRSQGVNWSMKHVAKDAASAGKRRGRINKGLAAYSAYQRYQKCRGD